MKKIENVEPVKEGLKVASSQTDPNAPNVKAIVSSTQKSIFPKDPRHWSREQVAEWLLWAKKHYKIETNVDVEKFRMNGLGLVFLSREGFLRRVPAGGDKLFNDFRRRFVFAIMEDQGTRQRVFKEI